MRIGVFTPFSNPFATAAIIKAVGQAADRAGFASMWLPEHVVLFDEYGSNYPYSPDGKCLGYGDHSLSGSLWRVTPLIRISIEIDRISSFFLFVTGLVFLPVSIFSSGYLKRYLESYRLTSFAF